MIGAFPPLQVWVGSVTQLIPPNYGIVDGNAFYVAQLVIGRQPAVGCVWKVPCMCWGPSKARSTHFRCRLVLVLHMVHAAVPLTSTAHACASQVGERVRCEGIPNTDGGQYAWRILKIEVEGATTVTASHRPTAIPASRNVTR